MLVIWQTDIEEVRTFKTQVLDTSIDVHHPISFLHSRRRINCKRFYRTDDMPTIPQLYHIKLSSSTLCVQKMQSLYL